MAAAEVPPIDRFVRHWRYGDVVWLRSGELLYTSDITGQFNLWQQKVGPRGEPGLARPLTVYADRSVRLIVPAPDGRTIFFAADQDGDEMLQLYRLEARGGDPVALTANRKAQHYINPGCIDPASRRILFSDSSRDPDDVDIVLLDLNRGKSTLPLPQGSHWSDALWDPAGRRFSVIQYHSNTHLQSFVHDLTKKSTVEIVPHESEAWVTPEAWTRDGRGLLVRSDVDREFKQLELVDVASGKRTVVAAPEGDVENVAFSSKTGTLIYSVNDRGNSTLYAGHLGGRLRKVTALATGCRSNLIWGNPLALAPDGRLAAVNWETGTGPPELRTFSTDGRHATQLTVSMVGGVPDGPLPRPKPVRFRSSDGLGVTAFYYRPKRRPKGRMPAVLSIHGGPESQSRPEWSFAGSLHAWLNAQGIAVLAPNIRGSTGFGKSYQKLIHHDWGGAELEDLRAAAEWLRNRPEIDASRLGVYGQSYGGFATLSCLARLPEYWKVGVDIFGPANLITMARSLPPHWVRFTDEWIGNPDREADFLRERSPITYVDNVRADLLVIQGANDSRVNKAESDQMVERLRASGRKVEYLVFDDEGHGFTRRSNELKSMDVAGRFLVDRLQA